MAFTVPTTITATSTINASTGTYRWNRDVCDNIAALADKPTVRCVGAGDYTASPATLTLTSGAETDVGWGGGDSTDEWDTGQIFLVDAGNTDAVDFDIPIDGIYWCQATLTFAAGSEAGRRVVRIYQGANRKAQATDIPYSAVSRTTVTCSTLIDCTAGDVIKVTALQNSGRDIDVLGYDLDDDDFSGSFSLVWLGEETAHTTNYVGAGWDTGTSPNVDDWWNNDVVGLIQLYRPPSARVHDATGVSVSDTTWTTITFDTEGWDVDTMHSTVSNTSRLTATTAGVYLVVAQCSLPSGGNDGTQRLRLLVNGSAVGIRSDIHRDSGNENTNNLTYVWVATANDYLEMQMYQDSTSSLTTATGAGNTFLAAHKIASVNQISGSQRLYEGWIHDPTLYYAHADQTHIPAPWADILTRDMAGMLYAPPMVILRAKGRQTVQGADGAGWTGVRWGRVAQDPWDFVSQERNFGDRFVVPVEGLWVVVANVALETDLFSGKFTADASTDIVTCTALNAQTGEVCRVSTSAADLPAGLSTGTDYYLIRAAPGEYQLATSYANALAGTVVDITDAGTGQHTLTMQAAQGQRGVRLLHNGTPQAGAWVNAADHGISGLCVADLVAAAAGDELTVEARVSRDLEAAVGTTSPKSRWACVWLAPLGYTTASDITIR